MSRPRPPARSSAGFGLQLRGRHAAPHLSPPGSRLLTPGSSQRGVALVITLILLTVITVMAITFLVLSRTEKGAVTTTTDQTIASMAKDAALDQAKSHLLAAILAHTNEFDYDLLVSQNYINPNGFNPAPGPFGQASPLNVNFDYQSGAAHRPLTANQWLRNLANLQYDPRVPVFPVTNRTTGQTEFRFYLDLNRNRLFDPTGGVGVTNALSLPVLDANGIPLTNYVVGDPQWIGILERPGFPHSSSNLFIARIAYIAIPVSKTLDVNYIHNYAKLFIASTMTKDGFSRNQGVGTWEINLASFLVDLNTNMWPLTKPNPYNFTAYVYNPYFGGAGLQNVSSSGTAFEDALALLRYRYRQNWTTLPDVPTVLGAAGVTALNSDFVDDFGGGPVMTGTRWLADYDQILARTGLRNSGYPGADNTNHFFTTQDLWDPSKAALGVQPGLKTFIDRLALAGSLPSTYDRYTFYRLLAQLGTDSAPEPPGKINLNYDNLVQRNPQSGVISATNFIPWRPVDFFNNAAIRLLANAGYSVGAGPTNILVVNSSGVTNFQIQIYPTNFYTPSVHQLLQLAANIYDANTNRTLGLSPPAPAFPSVFRPVFSNSVSANSVSGNQVFIVGYTEVTDTSVPVAAPGLLDLYNPNDRILARPGRNIMFSGIPLVIGAKKGWPNFNKFAMQTVANVTRKLQFLKTTASKPPYLTNQMYVVAISNAFGVEAWNSYTNPFPRTLQLIAAADMSSSVTNELGKVLVNRLVSTNTPSIVIPATTWSGFNNPQRPRPSFQVPVDPSTNTFWFLPDATYSQLNRQFVVPATGQYENPSGLPVPRWFLNVRARLRFILIDPGVNRIVDYVNLDDSIGLDLTDSLTHGGQCSEPYQPDGAAGSLWCTNLGPGGVAGVTPSYGVLNQIQAGRQGTALNNLQWSSFQETQQGSSETDNEIALFKARLVGTADGATSFNAPFSPTRNIYIPFVWQANDPLVHYTIGDLTGVRTNMVLYETPAPSIFANFGQQVNDRYEPWNANVKQSQSTSPTIFDLTVKDPLIMRSDDWDFPTNKFPNIGWLGRVHRGTPWQTIYLKSPTNNLATWLTWSGNSQIMTNVGQLAANLAPINTIYSDAALTQPWRDRYILDLFTTAVNDNAARGQLDINQTNQAAWSALFGGVVALTNALTDSDAAINFANSLRNNATLTPAYGAAVIDPAGIYDPQLPPPKLPPIVRLVNAINGARATNSVRPGVFTRLGDILAVPELTTNSPFLNQGTALDTHVPRGTPPHTIQQTSSLTDAAYERLPQQTLGLLKCDTTPRFVIYAWGQSLKPADHSLVTSGSFFGLCTNYQVTAEAATRAVVRIEGAPANPHAVVENFNVLPPDQ